MPTPVLMPALSPTMEEGTLAKWNVKEGDTVSPGDVIAEIETDKATMEVESIDEGIVGKIMVGAGTRSVKVNTPIAILLDEGESPDHIDAASVVVNSPSIPADGGGTFAPAPDNGASLNGTAGSAGAAISAGNGNSAGRTAVSGRSRIMASPLARRLAKAANIDLSALKGSGPRGRIVKRDIDRALREEKQNAHMQPADRTVPASSVVSGLFAPGSYDTVKVDGMRRTIAQRLTRSFNGEVPHFPLTIDVELDSLLASRARINKVRSGSGDGASRISVNDFIIKASAKALIAVPEANATYTEEEILLHRHADIGVAVAIDGGLITPIIWKAEEKGLGLISSEIRSLAARARERKLKPEEYQGGTFSVSNLGMYGIRSFASIVNQPQGAILSAGAGEQRVVVRDGAMTIATVMTVTLTCDHRVVDGAVGARFLSAFKGFIEEPATMLL